MRRKGVVVIAVLTFLASWLAGAAYAFEFKIGNMYLHEGKGNFQQSWNLRTHQDVWDITTSSARFTARIEALLDVYQDKKWQVQLYGLYNYWADWAPYADRELYDSILFNSGDKHYIHTYQYSNELFEIQKEQYVDINYGDMWNIRLGRQMISWGETADARVADVINPLDTKNLVAFPDWEDYKIGLWMMRLFYSPINFWQKMSFEFLLIPPNGMTNQLSPAGSGPTGAKVHPTGKLPVPAGFGAPAGSTVYFPNFTQRVYHHLMKSDVPANDIASTEFGLRLRGTTGQWDWTVSSFYTRLDTPIVDGRQGVYNRNVLIYNQWAAANGKPLKKQNKIYTYPFYLSNAVTFSVPYDPLKIVMRGEIVFNTNKEFNYGRSSYKVTRDTMTSAISIDRTIIVPYLSAWNRNRSVSSATTWTHYQIFGYRRNNKTRESIAWDTTQRESYFDTFTTSFATDFFWGWFSPSIAGTFNTSNSALTLSYSVRIAPGDHWRWTIIYQDTQNSKAGNVDTGRFSDQVILTARYEWD